MAGIDVEKPATPASGSITNAQLATEAQSTVKGRAAAAGTGAVTDLTATQVRTIIDTATTPSTQAVGDAAATGTADTLARGDHKHAWPSGAQFMAALSSTNAAVFSVNAQKLAGVADPTSAQDAATKNYVDTTGGGWTVVTKSGDESVVGSTTLQDDDHLFFTAVNGGSYEVEAVVVYASPLGAATPDMKVGFGEDATARGAMSGLGVMNASDTAANFVVLTNQGGSTAIGTSATKRSVKFSGAHQGAGGTFKFQWAQNTSDTNSTTVYTGSILRYRRVV